MEKTDVLRLIIVLGALLMFISFWVVPDEYPWYYEPLLFNAGLWPWLFAKKELKKMKSQLRIN
jgi:hypothetical protein